MIVLVSWVHTRVVECLTGSGSRRANDGNATRPTVAADEAVLVPVFGLALRPVICFVNLEICKSWIYVSRVFFTHILVKSREKISRFLGVTSIFFL